MFLSKQRVRVYHHGSTCLLFFFCIGRLCSQAADVFLPRVIWPDLVLADPLVGIDHIAVIVAVHCRDCCGYFVHCAAVQRPAEHFFLSRYFDLHWFVCALCK